MLLFAGLGNPGTRYAHNRHNIGFMTIDRIAERWKATPWRERFQGLVAEAVIHNEKVLLVKPQTFMNESGRSIGEVQRFFKISNADSVVFYDELDLAPGKMRVKTGGGASGHNGLRSIISHCGQDFKRVRLGIGHPNDRNVVVHYVLGDFSKAETEWVEDLTQACAASADLLVSKQDASYQNKVHLALEARGWHISKTAEIMPKGG